MKAIVATGDDRLARIERVEPPAPQPGEMLAQVKAVSVNRGELHRLLAGPPGWRPGWDFAGVVRVSGPGQPPSGTRVFGMLPGGGWAELVAVPADACAAVPAGLPLQTAAALPTVGLTALRMIRSAGTLTGRRVLVTGASGGVGRIAVQLCHQAGALVTAQAGSRARANGLDRLGADRIEVAGAEPADDRYDLILDSVGGPSLPASIARAAPNATIVVYGNSSQSPSTLTVGDFYYKQVTIRGFNLLEDMKLRPPAGDLAELGRLAAAGTLEVSVAAERDWTDVSAVLRALQERTINGKAVLRLTRHPD